MAGLETVNKPCLRLKPISVKYIADGRLLEINFEHGISYRYPVERLEFSRWDGNAYIPLTPAPTDAELEAVVLWPNGEIVEFETISQGFEIFQLISEIMS